MTQKEKLYEQVLIAENELRALTGEKPLEIITEGAESWRFKTEARYNTVVSLKSRLEFINRSIEKAQAKKKADKYWATPKGMKRKDMLESEMAELKDSLLLKKERYAIDAIALLKENLSERWEVRCDEITNIEIYLTYENGMKIFGHDFEIRYDDDFYKGESRIASNMGTMGSFDAINDEDRINLYITYSNILSNKTLINRLYGMMKEWLSIREVLRDKLRKINKELENPTI